MGDCELFVLEDESVNCFVSKYELHHHAAHLLININIAWSFWFKRYIGGHCPAEPG